MKRKLSAIGIGVAASVVLLAGNATVYAADKGFLNCGTGGAVRDPFGQCLVSAGGVAIPDCLPAMPVTPPRPMIASLGADANFDFDKYNLRSEGQAALGQLASDMSGQQVNSVDIVGHTDSIGSEAYNQGLSERRAQSAGDFLVSQGVNPGIVTTRGMGELQPIADNSTDQGRAQNRRVDIAVDIVNPQ